jgi:predicted nucleic acid-binding protein
MNGIIADTGPMVAYLDRGDRDHARAKESFKQFTRPLPACEAVIAEAL